MQFYCKSSSSSSSSNTTDNLELQCRKLRRCSHIRAEPNQSTPQPQWLRMISQWLWMGSYRHFPSFFYPLHRFRFFISFPCFESGKCRKLSSMSKQKLKRILLQSDVKIEYISPYSTHTFNRRNNGKTKKTERNLHALLSSSVGCNICSEKNALYAQWVV